MITARGIAMAGAALAVALAFLLSASYLALPLAPGEREGLQQVILGLGALLLAFIAAVYWGYALRERGRGNAIEVVVGLTFFLVAWAGLLVGGRPGLGVVSGGLVLHALWDLAHAGRWPLVRTRVPGWYVPFCVVVDGLLALAFLLPVMTG